jgi:hypothetical protein
MTRRLPFSVVILLVAASVGCNVDAKAEEKRLLAEINRVTQESREYLNSDEVRSRLIRLNELRPLFPERREDTTKAAQAVKETFSRVLEDDRRLVALYRKLLELPLSTTYANCINAQIQSQELMSIRSERIISEMDLFSDPSINDLQKLSEETQKIRGNDDLAKKNAELDISINQNCRPPSSGNETK